jgi:hypothetical protein
MEDFNSSGASEAAGIAILLVIALVAFVISLAIFALVAWFISENYKAIPAQFRKMEPGKVWLMLIPFFNLYWIFPVFLGLADSFKATFDSRGVLDVGDCGRQLALWYCICAAVSIVPCVQYISAPASLVLLILFLIKASELKKRMLMAPPPM